MVKTDAYGETRRLCDACGENMAGHEYYSCAECALQECPGCADYCGDLAKDDDLCVECRREPREAA
jgi:hypothetical protein